MILRHLTLVILFFSCNIVLRAQQKLMFDLIGAREYALAYNKSMINSGYAIDRAQMVLREAISNALPQVNASMDYNNALGAKISIRFAENMPATEIDIKPQSNFYLNVGQMIFSGNYIVGIQIANLYKDMSQLGYQKTELDVIAQVTDAYYLVLISEQLRDLLRQNLNNLGGLYSKTAVLEYAGIIEKTDLDQLWVQVNTLENSVSSAERQLEMATNLLRLQLGVSVDNEIELLENLDDLMAAVSFENFVIKDFRVEDNVDFRMARQQEFISEKMLSMQRFNSLPTLSAFYRYTYKLMEPNFDMTPANTLGLQLNIPIFSSGVRYAQTRQALIDLKTTQNNKDFLSDQLWIQERQLRFNLNNSLEAYENQKNNIEVSRRVYESLKLKYEQGLISGLDLIAADNNYLRAETEYIQAKMQVLNARLQLEKLYGNIQ
jgi:outer membrane protein